MTEDKTTITDNEVIARFMGGVLVKDAPSEFPEGYYVWPGGDWSSKDELNYDSDWNSLMPVWYKFRDLKMGNNEYNEMDHSDRMLRIADTIAYGSIEEAYKLLVEGIRWYNSTTQNKEQS